MLPVIGTYFTVAAIWNYSVFKISVSCELNSTILYRSSCKVTRIWTWHTHTYMLYHSHHHHLYAAFSCGTCIFDADAKRRIWATSFIQHPQKIFPLLLVSQEKNRPWKHFAWFMNLGRTDRICILFSSIYLALKITLCTNYYKY